MIRFAFVAVFFALSLLAGEAPKLPHGQKTMPGPALSPSEAIEKMTLPPGFKMECICSEPTVINPTAMTFDEQGRIWVCESFEYPRADAGKGKDRIKMLESSKGDGIFDKFTIIKEGLNIPCGIVMGNGGFYYTNSPDVVFAHLDENGKIDKEEVILSGFGRADRHELPNSLTWGPDGWLYGMNGVFNPTKLTNQGKQFDFTCAVWRWHPKTKKFELFAEGTSNPWGLDYNLQGDWFLSCCVIKHLFHITQSGYYHRQGGPYPSFTHKIDDTLVAKEEHYMAANAGLCIYNGNAYPPEYRGIFFIGNLHGSQVNRDIVTRNGSTYVQKKGEDLIDAHDKWFMPVSTKVGPDGCVYIMDWYDKYHCYQDSNRPDLDRERGRIYRLSYKDTPRLKPFDLKKLQNFELLNMLAHENQWQRREAQRLLNERFDASLLSPLQSLVTGNGDKQTNAGMHALWLLCSRDFMDDAFHLQILGHPDMPTRNWAVRMAGQLGKVSQVVYDKLLMLAKDPSPDVRLQVAVSAGRLTEPDGLPILLAMLKNPENAKDPIIPNIIYNNLKPMVKTRGEELMKMLDENQDVIAAFNPTVVKWLKECIAGSGVDPAKFTAALKTALDKAGDDGAKQKAALNTCIDSFNAASVKMDDRQRAIPSSMRPAIHDLAAKDGPAQLAAAQVALWWKDPAALEYARNTAADPKADAASRSLLIKSLGAWNDGANFKYFVGIFNDKEAPLALRKDAANALGGIGGQNVATELLRNFKDLPPELKAACVNNLVVNKDSAKAMLDALEAKQLASSDINSNNARAIAQLNDDTLLKRLTALWGKVKTEAERDPERVKVVAKMRQLLQKMKPGDAAAGWKVFEKNCQQCHKIYGKGNDVGPDLTGVGRDNLDLILNSIFDPNLVIGEGYYQQQVKMKDGTVLTGLVAETTDKTLSLKIAGGEIKKLNRDDIAIHKPTTISLMPEELEKTMTEEEFNNLVAFMLTKEAPK